MQSLLGILAAVYVPNWTPERIFGPSLRLDITEVDGQIIDSAAYLNGVKVEITEVGRWFNIPPDALAAFPDRGLDYWQPDRLP